LNYSYNIVIDSCPLCVSPTILLSVSVSTSSVRSSVYLSVRPSVCLSISPSICHTRPRTRRISLTTVLVDRSTDKQIKENIASLMEAKKFKDHIAFGIESVYRSFYVSVVCLSVHLSVCFSLSVCPFFHSSVRPYLCPLSVSLSLSLSPFIRLSPSVHVSVCVHGNSET